MIIISACLCGVNCKYTGDNNSNEKVLKLFKEGRAVLVCPEQLGGLTTPRPPHEIIGGGGSDVFNGSARVVDNSGNDNTDKFVKGAHETLKIAKDINAEYAILKANSPSCGCGTIYDGSFKGIKVPGNGVTSELLLKNGIKVYTEKDFE